MAKQTITKFAVQDEGSYFINAFYNTKIVGTSETSARFENSTSFNYYVLRGKNLDYDETGLSAGTLTSATFYDAAGHVVSSFSGLSADAAQLVGGGLDPFSLSELFLKGDDIITGSARDDIIFGKLGKDIIKGGAGDDYLSGDDGADTMTGGLGADSFNFVDKDKKNIITDFDSDGPTNEHDFLVSQAESFEKTASGNDTIVTFSNGSNVRLLDFLPSELDNSDVRLLDI